MSSIQTQTKLASVNQLNCQGCGNALSVLNPRAKYIACQYCGSVLDLNSEEHQILETLGKPERHAPFSFLELGMTGVLGGKTHQLISRTRWRMRYKEFGYEDGSAGYSNEVWVYDEWLMMDENKTYKYLIEDKTGYWLSEEIVPEVPMLLNSDYRMQFYQGEPMRQVQEFGTAEVIFFEGESNYDIKKGDSVRFSMYRDKGLDYSAEWRMKDEEEIKEIEFFRERPISKKQVIEAFGNNEQVTELQENEGFAKFVYNMALFGALAMLIMGIYAIANNGKLISSQSIPLSSLTQVEGVMSGAIDIPGPGLYKLEMRASGIAQNSEMYVLAYVMDEQKNVVNTLDGTFSYYSGYDSEGSWTESSTRSKKRFKTNKAGKYYLQLHGNSERTQTGQVDVFLRSGVMMGRYYLMALILFVVIAIIFRTRFK
ncbi:MAG: hypothetical protein AAFY71_08195 [Bacteroidota bacterium]